MFQDTLYIIKYETCCCNIKRIRTNVKKNKTERRKKGTKKKEKKEGKNRFLCFYEDDR